MPLNPCDCGYPYELRNPCGIAHPCDTCARVHEFDSTACHSKDLENPLPCAGCTGNGKYAFYGSTHTLMLCRLCYKNAAMYSNYRTDPKDLLRVYETIREIGQ